MNKHRYLWAAAVALLVVASCDSGDQPDQTSDPVEVETHEEALSIARRCAGPLGLTCPANQYCKEVAVGRCPSKSQYGVCATRPQICTKIFKPVCGCDGKTYSNACVAAGAGVAVAHEGECRKGPFCGGIAGIPCPGQGTCVDDPSDNCDPKNGGADCGGICQCNVIATCAPGSHFDRDPAVCACVPSLVTR